MLKAFKEFIQKGNVVDLAVAVILGAAFGAVVKSLTQNVLMPIIGIVGGRPTFDDYFVTINNSQIRYGSFLTELVNFLIIAFALFVIVQTYERLQNLRKKKEVEEEEEETELEVLKEIRDLLLADRRAS